jgi:hypothetical protein
MYHYVGSELSLFGQSRSARVSMLMTRCLVWIRSKFRRHNPDVLCCTILNMQSENSRVILLKFHPDLNQASCHKHALLVTRVSLGHIFSYRCRTKK